MVQQKLLLQIVIVISCISCTLPIADSEKLHTINKVTNNHYRITRDSSTYDPMFKSVVLLERIKVLSDGEKGAAAATGFIVKNELQPIGDIECTYIVCARVVNSTVMTVKHFCDESGIDVLATTQIDLNTIRVYSGQSTWVSDNLDLCLVTLYDTQNVFLPVVFANTIPETGSRVHTIGSPLGHYPAKVSGYVMASTDNVHFETTLPTIFGFSGSPVYNDDFEVVSMSVGVIRRYHHLSFSIRSDAIINELVNANN